MQKALFFKSYKEEYRNLVRLGFPVMVTQIGVIVVSFADTMMVGRYGLDELAASAFVNSIFLVAMVMIMGFAGGITPIVGALFGRGDDHGVGRTMKGALQVNVILALVMTTLMGILYLFLDRMGQPADLLPLIRKYYLIILAGLLPTAIFSSCQQIANGVTDTAMPMWLIIGADVLNVIGNYALIFGHFGFPELGLVGAGISTLASRVVAAVAILLIVLRSRRYCRYRDGRRDDAPIGVVRRKVWVTSYPVMIQSGVECMLWSLGAVVCGWFGKVQIAAYQVVNTIGQLGFMIYMSFGVATSIRSANFTGAGNPEGVRRIASAGIHLNLFLATLSSAVFLLFGGDLISFFTKEPEVVQSALGLIVPLVVYQYFDAAQLTYSNALRGTSNVKPLLWISVLSYIVIGIPAMYLLARTAGFRNVGVYYSFDIALVAAWWLLYTVFSRTVTRMKAGLFTGQEA